MYLVHRLSTPPDSLDQLGDSIDLLDRVQNDLQQTASQFEPIQDQFNMLEKYEVAIPDSVCTVHVHVFTRNHFCVY